MLYTRATSLTNEAREVRKDLMHEFSEDNKEEGYKTFVDRQIEWGMLDPNVSSELTAATRWVGKSGATTLAIEDRQPVEEWNSQSWQPATWSGATSSW